MKAFNHVAVEANKTTHVAFKSKCSRMLSFVKCTKPEDRFVQPVNVTDTESLYLTEELETFNLKNNLIVQTYDDAACMSGKESRAKA